MYQFLNGLEDELGLEPQVNGGDATRNGLLDIVTKIAGGAKQNKRAPVQSANEGFGGFGDFGGGGYDDPGFDDLGAWNAGPATPPQTGARGPSIASLFANGGADLVGPDPFGGVEEAMGRAALRQRRLDADAQKAAAAETRRRRDREFLSPRIRERREALEAQGNERAGLDIMEEVGAVNEERNKLLEDWGERRRGLSVNGNPNFLDRLLPGAEHPDIPGILEDMENVRTNSKEENDALRKRIEALGDDGQQYKSAVGRLLNVMGRAKRGSFRLPRTLTGPELRANIEAAENVQNAIKGSLASAVVGPVVKRLLTGSMSLPVGMALPVGALTSGATKVTWDHYDKRLNRLRSERDRRLNRGSGD